MSNTNKALALFKAHIGKPVTDAPSPFANWLNGTLRSAEEGATSFDFFVREDMCNPVGIMHGGVTAGIMDEVVGASVFTLGRPEFYATVTLVTDYFKPANKGETVTAKGKILKKGKRMLYAECEIVNNKEELLARGTSHFIATNMKAEK